MIRIGVVGYSGQKFDGVKAQRLLEKALLPFKGIKDEEIELVSGLTDVGISALAYRLAKQYHWKTVGIACSKATDYDCFKVDKKIIVGNNWGDESATFLKSIDVIVRIGGGKQSHAECLQARNLGKQVIEYELPAIVESKVNCKCAQIVAENCTLETCPRNSNVEESKTELNYTGTSGFYSSLIPDATSIEIIKGLCNILGMPFNQDDELHCTLMYSPDGIPNILPVPKLPCSGLIESFDLFGPNEDTLVLLLNAPYLQQLHNQLKSAGAVPTYPEYRPHVTVAVEVTMTHADLNYANLMLRRHEPMSLNFIDVTVEDIKPD